MTMVKISSDSIFKTYSGNNSMWRHVEAASASATWLKLNLHSHMDLIGNSNVDNVYTDN
jgi:hypothetical protein